MPEYAPQTLSPTAHEMQIRPIGIVRNKVSNPIITAQKNGIRLEGNLEQVKHKVNQIERETSEIIIHKNLENILRGIENYSHIFVLYWAHLIPEESRTLTTVHPMGRKEIPAVGIFATCSPARPNPVLMSNVRLLSRKENVLTVRGLDAIDNSPVVDIKPCIKAFPASEEIRIPQWMKEILQEMDAPTGCDQK